MKSRSVSIAWKIMMVPNLVGMLFGLIFTLVPDVMNSMGYESYTGQSWSAFVSASPKIADLLLLTAGRVAGVHMLVVSILAFGIILMSFRNGERWSWYTLLVGYTLAWTIPGVAALIMGLVPVAIASVVFLLLVYIALAISAKDILSKKIAPVPNV
jgi:hypothetical protein